MMDDLEQIMRKIHVLFAKCEPYGDEKDNRIIVPKKEVFRLLEQLNYHVIALMDQYEGTKESRERGLADYQREGERIMELANAGAEDVYAASLIYTDNVIEEMEAVIADAKESLWSEFARMAGRLDEQARVLTENQEEIRQQLDAMAQGKKYLSLIERENERLRKLAEAEAVEEKDFEEADEQGGDEASGMVADDFGNNENNATELLNPKEDGTAGHKQSGTKKKKNVRARQRIMDELEAEWEEQEQKKPVRKIGTAVYQDVGQAYDTPVKKVSYEIRVNQAYFDQLGEGAVDLDAEYEQWKEEQAMADSEGESDAAAKPLEQNAKRGLTEGKKNKKKNSWRKKHDRR